MLDIEQYEAWVSKTAKHPPSLNYPASGLAAEAGEFSNDLMRMMRKHHKTEITVDDLSDPERHKMAVELGDTLWNLTRAAQMLGLSIIDIANLNYKKLLDREQRGIEYRTEISPDA